ncbi:MAG TPA: aminotransferase class V-fold PLP-dependent enzyme [Acidimicrobiales bacterium]|nr:aminotransferase class V-fold PLP-dependent enzyme [Acidimicrobiales bacterium]
MIPDDVRAQFHPARCYLDTATVGLPPDAAVRAIGMSITEWQGGRVDARSFDAVVDRSRANFARLVATTADRVGISATVSEVSGMVAASLPAGATVVAAKEEFTSVLWPFLVRQRAGELTVRTVPLAGLLDEVPGADLVAVSAAQSADGRVTDLDALAAAAAAGGTRTYVDLTQAASWLPVTAGAFDVTAAAAYKWLCCPRGTAFVTVCPAAAEWLQPIAAGWYAGEDPWASVYGPPLRLATDGRAYGTSPAWLGWAAAAPTLQLLADVGVDTIHAHDVALADRVRKAFGLPPAASAIVSLPDEVIPACQAGRTSEPGAPRTPAELLAAAGVASSNRAGATRVSFHLYNGDDDVERLLDALGA